MQETGISNINFYNVEDLLILVCYLLKLFGVQKRQIKALVNRYIDITTEFIIDISDKKITSLQIREDTISKAHKILDFL